MRLRQVLGVASKELTQFFATALGYLFLGAFLLLTLFTFFWVEAFFARNIADVRPLFEWMPVLLVFLAAALTMRMWSEERRSGTLEFLATLPVSTGEWVVGKFLACWSLLAVALLLTLPLPLTVSVIGDLDWGPVWAGYIAAMLLGGAYIAIGLFVSALTSSQIVSLLLATLFCGVFYLAGSSTVTGLFGNAVQEVLASVSSGARFEAITRGILDLRDLYFFGSVLAAFLVLNVYALERSRWAEDGNKVEHRKWHLGTALLVTNLLVANVWMSGVTSLRVDMTQNNLYSLSPASKSYLDRLAEPLLIRGYFSSKTHPALAPLVPRIKDLLAEYEVHGNGQVRVEMVDPLLDPELEDEANSKYGITAATFQVPDRYQTSLVNSYFDVLIEYGDEYEVLSFRDLIEVKVAGEGELDVQLKNPEFDLTRAVKQVLYGFQGGGSVFDNINQPVRFVGYLSADDKLPEPLRGMKYELEGLLADMQEEAGGKLDFQILDPEAGDASVALDIAERFGFQPMSASLFDESLFFFYLTLQGEETVVQIAVPNDLSADGLRRGIEEGLKRFATGLLKNVVLVAPEPVPAYLQQQGEPPTNQFTQLQGMLSGDFNVVTDNLTSGVVPAQADLVMVMDPQDFTPKQVFALDQYLMKGGTVVLSSGAYAAQFTPTSLIAAPRTSGLSEWLQHHGIEIGSSLVMDPQNAMFPVPVTRQAGGFSFTDYAMLDYPYFADIRDAGFGDNAAFAGIPQITVSWGSPLLLQPSQDRTVTPLLTSSAESWLSQDTDIMPRIDEQGISAFVPGADRGAHVLAGAVQGRFESYFQGQQSPLLETSDDQAANTSDEQTPPNPLGVVSAVIEKSSEAARLIVFGSNDFLSDQTIQMVGSVDGTLYLNSVQLMANLVDWVTEDESLVSIRARGNFNRTLPGMEPDQQSMWEGLNYFAALLGVGLVWLFVRYRRQAARRRQLGWLASDSVQGEAA